MDFSLSSSLVGSAVSNPDKLALDLQFATDKTLTARKGPTPAFTRGSGATFVDSDGLVKYGPENLMVQSENFLSGWTVFGTSVQSVSSTNPFGEATSYKLTENSANVEHGIFRSSIITSGLATESIYAKEAGRRFCYLRSDATTLAVFDLIGGTVTQVSAGTTAFMTDAGNGWWGLSFTSQLAGNYVLKLSNAGTGILSSASYLGDGTSGVLIWGAQLERSSTARTYIPTTTAAVYGPRFDHDPVTLACNGLLIEESRTNNSRYSGALVLNTGWLFIQALPATSGTGPDGNTAYQVTEAAALDNHLFGNTGGTGGTGATSVVSGTVYTGSIFLKKVAGSVDWVQLTFSSAGFGLVQYANFNIGTGTVGNSTGLASGTVPRIEAFPNGWYRCSISVAATATTSSTSNIVVAFTNNLDVASRTPIYTGSVSNSVLATMCQFETGSFPTSYIPTTTASVIRSADVCSISGSDFSGIYNQPEGTLFADVTPQTVNQASSVFTVNTSTFNNTNGIYKSDSTTQMPGKRWAGLTNLVGNNPQAAIVTSTDVAVSRSNLAYAYKLNNFAFAYAGTIVGTDTSGTLPPSTSMRIGSRDDGLFINGHLASVRYYKKRLPNAKLVSLTT